MPPAARDSVLDEVNCLSTWQDKSQILLPEEPIFDHCSSCCVIYVVGRGGPTREQVSLCLDDDRAICVPIKTYRDMLAGFPPNVVST